MSNPKAFMRTNESETVRDFGNAMAEGLMKAFTDFGPSAVFRNCDNCRHMTEDGPAVCNKYGMTPPASVIVVGCDEHDDKEDVPF